MNRVLLVEDDPEIAESLSRLLRGEGFAVQTAATAADAVALLNSAPPDAALVDIALPDASGFAVLTELRRRLDIPVIFVTASGDEASVVTALRLGADDYVAKPFRPRELIARLHAALRRCGRAPSVFTLGGLVVDAAAGTVALDGREVFLSALEYRLLLLFVGNPRAVLTRERLLGELWDAAGEFVSDNALSVYIKRLRQKLGDDPAHPRLILTVRGVGYRLGGYDAAQ